MYRCNVRLIMCTVSVTNSCLDDVIAATIEDLNIDSCVRVIVYIVHLSVS